MKAFFIFTLTLMSVLSATLTLAKPAQAQLSDYSLIATLLLPGKSPFIVTVDDNKEKQAQAFIQKMGQDAISFLANDSLSQSQKEQKFRALLNDNFDMRTIGRFALGRNWRVATQAQKREYQSLFKDMIVRIYAQRFNDYDGQDFVVNTSRPTGKSDYLVPSLIVPPSGPKVKVDWRIREKNGQFKVIDVIIEGVSMSLTQRSEFASIVQRGGGDVAVLIAHLRE